MAKKQNLNRFFLDEYIKTGYDRHMADKERRRKKAPRKNSRKHGKFSGQSFIGDVRLENNPKTYKRWSNK